MGMTRSAFAAKAGLPASSFALFCNGTSTSLRAGSLERVAAGFGLSVEELEARVAKFTEAGDVVVESRDTVEVAVPPEALDVLQALALINRSGIEQAIAEALCDYAARQREVPEVCQVLHAVAVARTPRKTK